MYIYRKEIGHSEMRRYSAFAGVSRAGISRAHCIYIYIITYLQM